MAKVTLEDISSGHAATTLINANNTKVEVAMENTLSRDGTSPNQMGANLDMNGYRILNQSNPISVSGFNWEGGWATATSYSIGDVIENGGSAYICIVAHTSGTFATDLAAVKWQLVAQASLPSQTGNSGSFLTTDGSTASWQLIPAFVQTILDDTSAEEVRATLGVRSSAQSSQIFPISASVASNALTITLNPCVIDFRSSTPGSGTINTRTVSSAISTTISAGSTGGTSSGVLSRIYVIAMDVAGTVELAWIYATGEDSLDETGLFTTLAEGGAGGADTPSFAYSTTARSSVPYRVVGFIESTQATAGQWATAPSLVQGAGGHATKDLFGIGNNQTWWNMTASRAVNTTYTNTTGRPIQVVVAMHSTATSTATLIINNALTIIGNGGTAGTYLSVGAIIPHGTTYKATTDGGTPSLASANSWQELR